MRYLHHAVRTCGIVAAMATLAATSQLPLPAGTWRIGEAPPGLAAQVSEANLIIVSLHDALLRELTSSLRQGGPVFALKSCHVDLEGVARRLGRSRITAGRTSDRLRNPGNVAPRWAADLVRDYSRRPAHASDGFVVDLGHSVGVLRPILEQPVCASCHGPAASLTPAVRDALRRTYPNDRAVGFRPGDVRGWFWVELPKSPVRTSMLP